MDKKHTPIKRRRDENESQMNRTGLQARSTVLLM